MLLVLVAAGMPKNGTISAPFFLKLWSGAYQTASFAPSVSC